MKLHDLGRIVVAVLLAAALVGCSTTSLGRLHPYLAEVEDEGCEELAKEMRYANAFCAHARENSDYDKGSDVASSVLLGINTQMDEVRELHQAWKSAIVRRHGLENAWEAKACGSDKPEWTCPRPCGSTAKVFRHIDADPESCVAFSNKEVRRYGFTECTNNRGQSVKCPG